MPLSSQMPLPEATILLISIPYSRTSTNVIIQKIKTKKGEEIVTSHPPLLLTLSETVFRQILELQA